MKKLLGAFLWVGAAVSAIAGSVTFELSGTLTDGAVLGGTMTVDQVAGTVTAFNFTIGPPDSLNTSVIDYDAAVTEGANTVWLVSTGVAPGPYPALNIFLPTSTLVGYGGGSLCSVSVSCGGSVSGVVLSAVSVGPQVESGSLVVSSEPGCSSLASSHVLTFGQAGGSGTVNFSTSPAPGRSPGILPGSRSR